MKTWQEKQLYSAQSKISVVFATFFGATSKCIEYAGGQFPWLEFSVRKSDNENIKASLPAPKYRIHDAAFCKSIMLCYRDPFHKSSYPYRSSIESVHGLTPDVDFIYFDDTQDLTNKISEIFDEMNFSMSSGFIFDGTGVVSLRTSHSVSTLEDLQNIAIGSRDGNPVLLKDVATISRIPSSSNWVKRRYA